MTLSDDPNMRRAFTVIIVYDPGCMWVAKAWSST
jgi:hypothetical protein